MPLQWRNAIEEKPVRYQLVIARCAVNGTVQERNAFWTGSAWRVVGDKHRYNLSVIEWDYQPDEAVSEKLQLHLRRS